MSIKTINYTNDYIEASNTTAMLSIFGENGMLWRGNVIPLGGSNFSILQGSTFYVAGRVHLVTADETITMGAGHNAFRIQNNGADSFIISSYSYSDASKPPMTDTTYLPFFVTTWGRVNMFRHIFQGQGTPTNDIGDEGDIYLQYVV